MADQQLKIDLTAKDKTAAAFRALNNRLAATRTAAVSVGGAIAKLTVAAGAMGTGLFVATKKALSFADEIAKTADKVGVSTDALQQYRFAAELAGVKTDELDKALRKLQQSAGEATTKGTGTAADTFRMLGLEADLTSGKLEDGVVRFRAVIDALNKVESQAQKSSLAAGLFGARLGPQMMNLINQGLPAIDKANERFRAFGGILTEDVLRTSETAIDRLTELESILKKQLTNALVQAGPKIVEFGNRVVENMPKIIGFLERVAVLIGLIEKPIDVQIVALSKQVAEAQQSITRTKRLAGIIGKDEAKRTIDALQQEIDKAEAKIKELQDKGAAAVDKIISTKKPDAAVTPPTTTSLIDSLEKQKENEKFVLDIKRAIAEAAQKEKEILDAIKKDYTRIAQDAQFELDHINSTNVARERALAQVQLERRLLDEKIKLQPEQLKFLEDQLDLASRTAAEAERQTNAEKLRIEAAERQKELQQQIADIMQDGIRTANEAISGLISGTMKWKDALGLVLNKVLDIVTQMGKTKSGGFSLDQLFKLGGSFLTSMFAPSAPGAGLTGPELYYHNGGMVNRRSGMGFRSDERMIVARTGERVLNRGQAMMAGADGGVTLNQTINLTTGIQQTVRAEVMSLAPQIAAQAKAAVLDAKRRGGGFSAAFA